MNMTTTESMLSTFSSLLSNSTNSSMNGNSTDYIDYGYYYDDDCYTFQCVYVSRYRNKMIKSLTWLTTLLSILGVLGILGNGIVITVFVRTSAKHTSMYFMLMLAIMDLMVCSLVIPGMILSEWRFMFYYDALCKALEMLRYFSIPTSAMVLVAIACDRFILICTSPNIQMTKTTAKILICVMLGLGVCFSIPPVLGMGVYAMDDYGNKHYTGYCVANYMHITLEGLNIYWYVVTATFGVMILAIATMYTLIFVTVYQQNKKWRIFHQNKVGPYEPRLSTGGSMLGEEHIRQSTTSTTDNSDSGIITMADLKKTPKYQQTQRSSEPVAKRDSVSFDDQRCPVFKARHFSTAINTTQSARKSSSVGIDTISEGSSTIAGPSSRFVSKVQRHNEKWGKLRNIIHSSDSASSTSQGKKIRSISQISSVWRKTSKISLPNRKLTPATSQPKIRSRRTHVKTTQVLFTVTIVYIISFLPTFLMTNNIIPVHKVVFYMYFINNAVNPIIYSFMNPRFRQEVVKLFKCRSHY